MNVKKSVTLNHEEMSMVVAALTFVATAEPDIDSAQRASLLMTADKITTQVRQQIQEAN